MEYDAIWQAFARTGDPLYYLLYKQVNGGAGAVPEDKGRGDLPRPTD